MGYKAKTKDNKAVLFCKLKEHMVKQKLWKVSKEKKVSKRKGSQRRKPIDQRVEGDRVRKKKTQELETVCSKVSNSSLRQLKRFKRSKKSKKLSNPTKGDYLGRPKKKQRRKKYGISEEKALVPQLLYPECTSFQESRSTLRPSKRLRKTKQLKACKRSRKPKLIGTADLVEDVGLESVLRRSKRLIRNQPNLMERRLKKRSRKLLALPISAQDDTLRRGKKKRPRNKLKNSKDMMLVPHPLHPNHTSCFKGLHNLGQTCYFNAIIQCLFHSPFFRDVIENVPQVALSDPVLRELRALFTRMASNGPVAHLSPSRCFSAAIKIPECERAQMNKNKQEDAAEFFRMLIEHFSQKFKPLADIFEGKLRSTRTCQQCFQSSSKTESFKLLSLSFPACNNEHDPYSYQQSHNIHSFLDDFVREEMIYDYKCAPCDAKHPSTKRFHIVSPPKVLALQLKRFYGLEKIKDFVEFPLELALKYNSDGHEQFQLYRITGVLLHKGQNISEGHYVGFVNVGGKWVETDDSSIREVHWQTVRKAKVYILFYMRE